MSYDGLKDKILLSILFLSFSGIVFSSSYHIDSQLQFNAFAQTSDPSTDTGASSVPSDNSTDTMPGDNSTGTANSSNMDTTGSNNSTSVPDVSSTNPTENETMSTSDTSGQQETIYPPSTNNTMPSNMATSQHGILPPLQQLKSGVLAKDVQCKQGFTLILKIEDGSPACVDTQVSQILIQRGW